MPFAQRGTIITFLSLGKLPPVTARLFELPETKAIIDIPRPPLLKDEHPFWHSTPVHSSSSFKKLLSIERVAGTFNICAI